MSSTPQPSQKRQATLTSFFTPKAPTNGLLANSEPSSSPGEESSFGLPQSSKKRTLEADKESNEKQIKTNCGTISKTDETANASNKRARKEAQDTENVAIRDPTASIASSHLRSSGRARRYLYNANGSRAEAKSHDKENDQKSGNDNDHGNDPEHDRPLEDYEGEEAEDENDTVTKRDKEELHRRFVKRLGHPDSVTQIKRRCFALSSNDDDAVAGPAAGYDGEEDANGAEEYGEPPQVKSAVAKKSGIGKLTPMEVQFLTIKRQHLDTILVVEVGYKFRFFGEDARIAAKELGIVCIPGKFRYDEHPSEAHLDRFASASIPVPRLPVHVKRLVAAGHKVGVVRQMETAALKKVGDNRNAPFVRRLTSVYTKGTYIDELGELENNNGSNGAATATSACGYLLSITESNVQNGGTDEKVDIGILAVQPATGDILYDTFEDGFMRNEIETRLLHISPCELLIVGDLSRATEKLVQHLSGSATNVFGDRTRVERLPRGKASAAEAYSHIAEFYAGKLARRTSNGKEEASSVPHDHNAALLEEVLRLPESVTICLSAMITHLTEYGLQHLFNLTKYFTSFTTRQNMLLNGTTLESLEVYRNTTDHGIRGSLLWALDKTQTRFGHRLLRKWIGRPLLDRSALEMRMAAVAELRVAAGSSRREKLERVLNGTKTDLERSLIRIYYGKCTRPEFVVVLQDLQRVASEYAFAQEKPAEAGFASILVRDALAALPAIRTTVVAYLDRINGEAARRDDKYEFFREVEESDDITNHKVGIAAVELELDEHRTTIGETLRNKKTAAPPPYVTVAGIEYLVEVPNADLRRVPASWIKISGTKKVSRFHTPTVVELIKERDQHKEALAAACDAAFADLLKSVAACYQPLRDAVAALATLDCLLSLARVAALPGYVKPTLLPSTLDADGTSMPPTLDIRGGRHPIAEHMLPSGYIPFTTRLAGPAPRALLITGPNMGGKSSFVRAVALLTLLAQIGSFVPAEAMSLTLVDAIYTRTGARDNLFAGESTFMVEVSETAAILRAATPRSLVVFDELGRGTSTHDGAAIAQAVLEHVVCETQCLTLFITHYQNLGRVAEALGPPTGLVQNVHMRFTATKPKTSFRLHASDHGGDNANGTEEITFLYEVGQGVAHRSYGLNVARLAHIPQRVLDVAFLKSRELEENMRMRRLRAAAWLTIKILNGSDGVDQTDYLLSSSDQL
ncbi:DNA mismatch repair protein MutS, C-terminal domain protein [Niveomyces insectorum RCEF 264]|uniref:MutS protein homolog 3 n=1 Tax=Niveomyces insectorum RCEF 264 TaxID=1081102 RepID=A0A167M5J8_9HYPO|nr:DNA mismatch repair protein MutS, C-terminal domain protein [Niveomyces insectorum RCEF 264]